MFSVIIKSISYTLSLFLSLSPSLSLPPSLSPSPFLSLPLSPSLSWALSLSLLYMIESPRVKWKKRVNKKKKITILSHDKFLDWY